MFSIFSGFKTLVQKIIFLFLLRVIEMLLLSTMAQMGIIVGTVSIGSKKSGSTIPCCLAAILCYEKYKLCIIIYFLIIYIEFLEWLGIRLFWS